MTAFSGPLPRFFAVGALFAVACVFIPRFGRAFCASQCFTRVVPRAGNPNQGLSEVPRVQTLTPDALEEDYVRKGLPVLVEGGMSEWPAMRKWTFDYFGRKFGDYPVNGMLSMRNYVQLIKYTEYLQDPKNAFAVEAQHEALRAEGFDPAALPYFSHNEDFFLQFPELLDDVDHFRLTLSRASKPDAPFYKRALRELVAFFDVLPHDLVRGPWMQSVFWMGPAGTSTSLHYDDDPVSVLHQFVGKKRVRLFSSDQSKLLSPSPACATLDEYGTRFSRVPESCILAGPGNETCPGFPEFAKAKSLVVDLNPGEYLYIPSGWWHAVEVLTPSISVASRSYTECEAASYLPNFIVAWFNERMPSLQIDQFCITPEYLD